jgi:hypothetical protein
MLSFIGIESAPCQMRNRSLELQTRTLLHLLPYASVEPSSYRSIRTTRFAFMRCPRAPQLCQGKDFDCI